jgi:hypothetical protein
MAPMRAVIDETLDAVKNELRSFDGQLDYLPCESGISVSGGASTRGLVSRKAIPGTYTNKQVIVVGNIYITPHSNRLS